MRLDRRLVQAIAVIGAATVMWLLLTIVLIASTLEPEQREVIGEQLLPRLALIGVTWVAGLISIGATLRWLFRRYASAPARLLEQARVLLAAPKAAPMQHQGTTETQALAEAIFQLASQRDSLLDKTVTAIVAQFTRKNAANLFTCRGGKLMDAAKAVKSNTDFDLITWLVIK